jgi:hypothetical protein
MPKAKHKAKANANASNSNPVTHNDEAGERKAFGDFDSGSAGGGSGAKVQTGVRVAGHPSMYRPEYCELIIRLGAEGKLPAKWAAAIGVSKITLHVWRKKFPEFAQAFDVAKTVCESWWLESNQNCALSETGKYNHNAVKFILSAAFGMSEKSGVDLTTDGNPISALVQKLRSENK